MKTKTLFLVGCMLYIGNSSIYAQSDYPDEGKIITSHTVIHTDGSTSFIQSAEMKDKWKNSFMYAIVIPTHAGIKSLIALNKLLQDPQMPYNPENTLVIYADKEKQKLISEVAQSYTLIELELPLNVKTSIREGEIVPVIPDDHAEGYDFKLLMKKEL